MAQSNHAVAGKGLIAVLLITRSKPGPKLVFHYPRVPKTTRRHRKSSVGTDESETDTDGETEEVETTASENSSHIPHVDTVSEHVLGLSIESLEKLLSPGRWCDRTKFEVCLDGLTFVGHPIYSLEDGKWVEGAQENPAPVLPTKSQYGEYHMYLDPGSIASTPPHPVSGRANDFKHMPDSLDSHPYGASMGSTSTSSGRGVDQIAMFHVVFVIGSHCADVMSEVRVVYKEVAMKLGMALHYLQKQSNYVAAESRRLLSLRTKANQTQHDADDLWKQMVETSELAWALKEIYEKVREGEVAGIRLNGMEMSLHTGNSQHRNVHDRDLTMFSAILLLEPKEALLRELSHSDAMPLAHLIREHVPSKNLQKHATNLGIPINDVLLFARHLIKWRKAQVISPLHQRNTYVVGPEAPLDQLPVLIEKYSKAFPSLPSLPNMLMVLSGTPIKYGRLIPSRDHRGAYMSILGFLMQHKLVVQLSKFGWLRIPRSLLKAPAPELDPNKRPMSVRALLSPRLGPVEDDQVSVSSERTAIPTLTSKASKRLSSGTQISLSSAHPPSQLTEKSADDERFLIVNPAAATTEEAELLTALTRSLTNSEMKEHFPELIKALDGETAFEQIAARMGLKRAKVEEWLDDLDEKGYLLTVRYI